jgi:hypothetical protein
MAAQAQQMQGYFARVESFLERAEAALSKLSLLPAMLKTSTMSGPPVEVGASSSTEDKVAEIYVFFSPRAGDNSPSSPALPSVLSTLEGEAFAAVMTPVLQIMPELQELCESPDLPLVVEHVKVNASTTLSWPEQSDVAPAPIPPPPPHSSDALFAEEICDLLSKFDVLIPGLGRSIACLLTGTPIKKKNEKMGNGSRISIRKEKSLRSKHNKSVTMEKALTTT